MIKKFLTLIFAFVLIATIIHPTKTTAATSKPIQVYMDGGKLPFQTPPIIKNNRTFVEMRPVFETAGIKLYWDQNTQTITGKKEGTKIKLQIGNKTAYLNGKAVQLDAAPFAKNNYTFVPLRFIGEATGYKVDWHKTFNLIHIHENHEFVEDRAFTKEQLKENMLETLREGKFPDFPVGLNDGVGVLLDEAGAPKIFRPGIPETEKFEEWMYGDYWFVFKNGDVNAIKVEPTRATITLDDVFNALGPAENVYLHDVSGNMIYAYYEGSYMYEFMYDQEKVISISLTR